MLFTRAKNIDYNSLHISTANGSNIERVTEYKYLGIWFDEKLTFKYHIDNLVSKLWQKLGFFYRNRTSFPMISRKRIVEAVFLSVLDYGDVLYRIAAPSTLKPLDSVYHSASDLLLVLAMVLTIVSCMIRWVGPLWQRGVININI
uniref:Uncharacterized protein n=1 Tax=Anguilla anguilla TaxID=7936 RepID=A0A0E9XHX0_ANGAN